MLRAMVLVVCLVSAGGIAAYSYYARDAREPGEPVYTVPAPAAAAYTPKAVAPQRIAPEDRPALARELQRELKRVGCYTGEITGMWTAASRIAMKTFVERVNAALPVDKPDPVLLSLVQGHTGRACGVDATADAARDASPDARAGDKTGAAATAAGAAAAAALATAGTATKGEPKPSEVRNPDAKKQEAKAPEPEAVPKSAPPEKRRPRRTAKPSQPPSLVSDFIKLFGN